MNNEEVFTQEPSQMDQIFHRRRSRGNLTERLEYLQSLDNKKWPYIYPVIIYLLILMVIGVVGNIIVLIVFTKRFKPSTNRLFILTLATFDILTCTLSIPGVIVELRFHYTFFFPALCRIFRASRMYFILVSMSTLVIAAVDRYRKVCHPLKTQYTIKSAGRTLLIANVLSLILTVFGAVVGGKRKVPTDREDVTGSNCSYDEYFIGKPIIKIYGFTIFIPIIVSASAFLILYSLIGRMIWKHRRFQFNRQTSATSVFKISYRQGYDLSKTTVASGYSSKNENVQIISTSELPMGRHNETHVPNGKTGHGTSAVSTVNNEHNSKGPPQRSTSKTTFTLFVITVVFLVSFLPFLILVAMWGSNWNFVNNLHGYTFTVYKIFFHSYHINNVVNCYIYCFFNPTFRLECKKIISSRKEERGVNSSVVFNNALPRG